ncbi:hypothetical protein MY10362_009234 [Beauveria mimosiformis]
MIHPSIVMARDRFKVIIVGGGPAGLALASILDRLHIDFIVLEAYGKIAPVIGACIAISPQALRIMDQIGCYETFIHGQDTLDRLSLRYKSDCLLLAHGLTSQVNKRHGYGVWFRDRAQLLDILYNSIQNKGKVLLNKKVVEINCNSKGVYVRAADGSDYHGDIAVGTDGVHSIVRREMWRLAQHESPGLFPENEFKDVVIAYRCMFGVAKLTPGSHSTILNYTSSEGYSYLTIHYQSGTHYWFVFEKLDKPLSHTDGPRYTRQDIEVLAQKLRHDAISECLTFGEIYDKSATTGMVPLQETVFDRWHFKRLITIGDSAHKINPITGLGGNIAIEDAAELANEIVRLLNETKSYPSDEEIDMAFTRVQSLRKVLATRALHTAAQRQHSDARQSMFAKYVLPLLLKNISRDTVHEASTILTVDATRVKALPVPRRAHFVPFRDEYPANPLGPVSSAILTSAAAIGIVSVYIRFCFCLYYANYRFDYDDVDIGEASPWQ